MFLIDKKANSLTPNKLAKNSNFVMLIEDFADNLFYLKTLETPSLNIEPILVPSIESDIHLNGTKAEYGQLQVGFIIDESYRVEKVIYDWLKLLLTNNSKKYAKILFLSNDKKSIVKKLNLYGIMPTNLDGYSYDTKQTNELILNVTMTIDYFESEYV